MRKRNCYGRLSKRPKNGRKYKSKKANEAYWKQLINRRDRIKNTIIIDQFFTGRILGVLYDQSNQLRWVQRSES